MHRIPVDQYLPSGRGEFTVRGVAEALEFTSLAIAAIKKKSRQEYCSIKVVRYSYNYIPGEEKSAVATFCSGEDVSDVVTPVKQKQNYRLYYACLYNLQMSIGILYIRIIILLTTVGRSVSFFIRRCCNVLYHGQQMSSYIYMQIHTIKQHQGIIKF